MLKTTSWVRQRPWPREACCSRETDTENNSYTLGDKYYKWVKSKELWEGVSSYVWGVGKTFLRGSRISTYSYVDDLRVGEEEKEFPRWLSGTESACRGCGFDPWVGKIPWRRQWQPTPVSLPGKSYGQRSRVGYSPWGHRGSDPTEWLSRHEQAL